MQILVGPGVFLFANVRRLPTDGARLNLQNGKDSAGTYALVPRGTMKMDGVEYPLFYKRWIVEAPAKAKVIQLTAKPVE